jgi:hypothetical protein
LLLGGWRIARTVENIFINEIRLRHIASLSVIIWKLLEVGLIHWILYFMIIESPKTLNYGWWYMITEITKK